MEETQPIATDSLLSVPSHMTIISAVSARDWLAAMAMQGILANTRQESLADTVASNAYAYADAMITKSTIG